MIVRSDLNPSPTSPSIASPQGGDVFARITNDASLGAVNMKLRAELRRFGIRGPAGDLADFIFDETLLKKSLTVTFPSKASMAVLSGMTREELANALEAIASWRIIEMLSGKTLRRSEGHSDLSDRKVKVRVNADSDTWSRKPRFSRDVFALARRGIVAGAEEALAVTPNLAARIGEPSPYDETDLNEALAEGRLEKELDRTVGIPPVESVGEGQTVGIPTVQFSPHIIRSGSVQDRTDRSVDWTPEQDRLWEELFAWLHPSEFKESHKRSRWEQAILEKPRAVRTHLKRAMAKDNGLKNPVGWLAQTLNDTLPETKRVASKPSADVAPCERPAPATGEVQARCLAELKAASET